MSGGRAVWRWVISRRNSCTLMATRVTAWIMRRRMDSFCSLWQRRYRFASLSTLHASLRERRTPTSIASCADASHASCGPRNDQARSRLSPIENIPRSSSASRRRRRVPSGPSCAVQTSRRTPYRRGLRSSGGSTANDPRAAIANGTDGAAPSHKGVALSIPRQRANAAIHRRRIDQRRAPPPCGYGSRPSSISRWRGRTERKASRGSPT